MNKDNCQVDSELILKETPELLKSIAKDLEDEGTEGRRTIGDDTEDSEEAGS